MSDEASPDYPFYVRPLEKPDRNWVAEVADKHWGSTKIVTRGNIYYMHLLAGFVAVMGAEGSDGEKIGLITMRHDESTNEIELTSLNSLREGVGVGRALVEAVKHHAQAVGAKRLWVITTNDNLRALKFYQRFGFVLAAVYPDALQESRKLKPQIPLVGMHGIPLRDEIELEIKF